MKHTSKRNTRNRKAVKRQQAVARQAAHDARTIAQQINLIGKRPGSSNKEVERLLAQENYNG